MIAPPEKVQQVADALRAECLNQFGTTWGYDAAWAFARTAIKELMEPTPAMVNAGWRAVGTDPEHVLRVMLSEALR